jgi:hypothetical protein
MRATRRRAPPGIALSSMFIPSLQALARSGM